MTRSPRSQLRFALAVALALLGLAAFAPAAFANSELRVTTLEDRVSGSCAPYTEPADGCSLREAVELAAEGEGVSGEVVIAIAVTGTIKIGDIGTLQVEAGSGVTALKISGPGKASLTIDAEKEGRAFEATGGSVTISGLTITKGFEDDFAPDGDGGGALLQSAGDVTLENLLLTENATESGRNGGSIDVEGGNLTIVDVVIEKSSVESDVFEASGGAIDIDSSGSTVTIRDSEITSSTAGEGSGGAIFQDEGSLVVEDSVISGNKAEIAGGGIAAEPDGSHTTVIEGTTISGNTVKEDSGGGLLSDTGAGGLILTESTISGNKAAEGGGVATEGPTTIVSSTISGNEATTTGINAGFAGGGILADSDPLLLDTSTVAGNVGGALFANSAEVAIHASTISANSNPTAGVGGIGGREEEASFTVRSSIVAGNTGPGGGSADCSAEVTSEGHNIVGTFDPGCDWPQGEGDQLGATLTLGALADNGGPTETMAPTEAANAAINHGGTPKPLDQRNLTRPVPTGASFTDVGAVEVQAPVNGVAPLAEAPEGMLEGESIVCNPGTWDNDTITSGVTYSYAWFADNSPIGTGSTYTLKAADANKDIACRVAANNGVTTSSEVESNSLKMDPGALSLTPSSHDFGNRKVGSGPSAPQSFTLKNEGGTAVTVSGASLAPDGAPFPVDLSACTAEPLGPGEQCTFEVKFAPTAEGLEEATLAVHSNAPDVTASLKGTGTAGALSITPGSFDFGSRPVDSGPSAAKTFEVTSTGNEAVTITTPSASGDFEIVEAGDECAGETLRPAEKCTLEVVFDPSGTGERTGNLTVTSDVPSVVATLSGTGLADAALAANPSELGYGSHEVGSGTTVRAVTVSNLGGVTASIDSVAISGTDAEQFSLVASGDGCDEAELSPSATCTIEVGFTPTAAGAQSANLEVEGDAPTLVVPLSGTGVAPIPPPPPSVPSAKLIGSGLFVGNAGGILPLSVACDSPGGVPCQFAVALNAGGVTLGSWSGTLAAGASAAAEVPLSPAARKQLGAAGTLAAEAVLIASDGIRTIVPVTLQAPPAPKLKLKSAKRAGNAIVFKLACQGYAAKCQGKLALSAAKGGAKVASGKVSVAKGTHEVRVPLTGAGKRLLEDEPRAQLKAEVSAKDPVYQRTSTATKKLRLAGP